MLTVNLRDARAGLSRLVDEAEKGEFVTITRNGKPVAALVPVEAAQKMPERRRAGLIAYLRTFPGGDFERHGSGSRDADL